MKPFSNLEEFLSIIDALMEKLLGSERLGWTPAGDECSTYMINFLVLVITSFFVIFFVETQLKPFHLIKKPWLFMVLPATILVVLLICFDYIYDIERGLLVGEIKLRSPKQAETTIPIVFPRKKEIDFMSADEVKDTIGRSDKYKQESISSCMMLRILSAFRLFLVATATLFCALVVRQLYRRKEHPHSESESVGKKESTKVTKSTKKAQH